MRGIRRTLTPTRDAVRRIVDDRVELDEGELFPRPVEIAFGDAYDKLLRATEALESSRDALGGVRDYLQGKIANDQNEVMKRLTVIASLLLLPTFIVGLYGQNFRHIPELAWGYGYWWSWGWIIADDDRPARVLPLEALDLSSRVRLSTSATPAPLRHYRFRIGRHRPAAPDRPLHSRVPRAAGTRSAALRRERRPVGDVHPVRSVGRRARAQLLLVEVEDAGDEAGKWQRFVAEYFPPKYAPLAAADGGLRSLLSNDSLDCQDR